MTITKKTLRRAGSALAAFALVGMTMGPAFAAEVSQSEALGVEGSLLGMPIATTGTATAVNDQSQATVTDSFADQLSVLPGQGAASTGALASEAIANDDGTSAACAGLVGEGGSISVGQDGNCTPADGTAPALLDLVDLPLVGTLQLQAGAVYATCTAGPSDAGPFTAEAHLADAALIFDPLIGSEVTIPIQIGQPISLPTVLEPLLTVDLNQTDSTGPETSATALHIGVLNLGESLVDLTVGDVTCGPNATVAEVPAIPAAGVPFALGTLVLAGVAGGFIVYRRRGHTAA